MTTPKTTSRCIALTWVVCAAFAVAAPGCGDDEEADACAGVTCSGHGTCASDASGAAVCSCDAGYVAAGTACNNVDECAAGNDDCADDATCSDTDGGFSCACNAGFTGDGRTCTPEEADPCDGNDCDPDATCTPVDLESYTCACNEGFVGDGFTCAPEAPFEPVACDPDVEENDCDYARLPLEAGGGVCVALCGDDADCPAEGWRCDHELAPEGETGVCLPNAACGDLTFEGECDGSTLYYCGYEGPVEVDCSEGVDGSNVPLTCQFTTADIGYDCISQSWTGGCGQVTSAGSCEGTVLTYCQSAETGDLVTVDCAGEGLACVVTDGDADCAAPGASGCGAVTEIGTCDGTTATWCDAGEVMSADCSDSDQVCGNEGVDFRCVDPVPSGGSSSVSGRFVFEKPALTPNGLGAISHQPVRFAQVTVRKVSDDSRLAQGYTAADGTFTLQYESDEDVYVLVTTQGEAGKHNHAVRDCADGECEDVGNLYGAMSASASPGPDGDVGETVITVDSKLAGAFNIFDIFVRGADFARANMGRYPPSLLVEWKSGSDTPGQTSYYVHEYSAIFIVSRPDDTDEFDDPVLLHEYGHFLEAHLSRSDSPGGDHDGSPTDPRLAWGEGYGTYVGCAIADTPIYIDTTAAGTSATDIREAGSEYPADLDDPKRMKQLVSEYLVSQILWTVAMGPNGSGGKTHAPTFDVLANYFTSFTSPQSGRGVEGVDLVDYLDGWFCKQHQDRPYIEGIVNGMAKFPYDYNGPTSCD